MHLQPRNEYLRSTAFVRYYRHDGTGWAARAASIWTNSSRTRKP